MGRFLFLRQLNCIDFCVESIIMGAEGIQNCPYYLEIGVLDRSPLAEYPEQQCAAERLCNLLCRDGPVAEALDGHDDCYDP